MLENFIEFLPRRSNDGFLYVCHDTELNAGAEYRAQKVGQIQQFHFFQNGLDYIFLQDARLLFRGKTATSFRNSR